MRRQAQFVSDRATCLSQFELDLLAPVGGKEDRGEDGGRDGTLFGNDG